jgi:putative transposase
VPPRHFSTITTETNHVCTGAVYNHIEKPKSMNGATSIETRVLRLRLKNKHAKFLRRVRRKDFLHQFSTRLVRGYDTIFVGNVSAIALVKTPPAKSSVLDADWSAFRTMLRYKCKCDFAGATFAEVNEAFSTQICSACNMRSGPKGIADLGIREWTRSECRTVYNRDVNAAKNILAAGRRRLAEGIPAISGAGRTSK